MKKQLLSVALLGLSINLSLFAQGNSLHFDGTNDYVSNATNSAWDSGTGNFTVEWWQYETDANSYPRIFSLNGKAFAVSLESGFLYCWLGGSYIRASSGTYRNTWVHFAITRSSGTVSFYKNGTYLGGGNNAGAIASGTQPLILGKASLASEYYGGRIDEFRLWNVVRTQTEIQNAMFTSLVGNEAGLVAYYNFDQGTAGGSNSGITTLNDITSNHHDGTLTNIALTGSTSNWVKRECVSG